MDKNALALLIHDNSDNGASVREALGTESRFKVQSVERVPTALARIAGGGVDVVILDLSSSTSPEIERLDNLLKLRGAAPQMPIIVVSDSEADGLVMRAIRAGTADYLTRDRCGADLRRLVQSALATRPAQPGASLQPPGVRQNGTTLTVLGGKGGVGATTVALNLASALAQSNKVILAELQPMFGTLSQYFRPHHGVRNAGELLKLDPAAMSPIEAGKCLWPYKKVAGLNILFGPQTAEQCGEIGPDHARAVLRTLSMLADLVVLDLPVSLSLANRAVIADSDCLVLVVERDPFSVGSGKRILDALQSGGGTPPQIGSVIVNRAPLSAPMDVAEIEVQLGIPTLGVIPPASDLCVAAQKAGAPLLVFDPDSLAARSLSLLAERVAPRVSAHTFSS
jgi:pilus assembly protein CpaE